MFQSNKSLSNTICFVNHLYNMAGSASEPDWKRIPIRAGNMDVNPFNETSFSET